MLVNGERGSKRFTVMLHLTLVIELAVMTIRCVLQGILLRIYHTSEGHGDSGARPLTDQPSIPGCAACSPQNAH